MVNQPKTPSAATSGGATVITGGTGACVTGSSYWDIGFRGDSKVTSHAASGFAPAYSVFSAAAANAYGGNNNTVLPPAFASQYCNGSRTPPELGAAGYAVPPGVNEFNAFPNPVFTLNPAGVVDEGNNWVNVYWGPLALTNPATGAVLGNYAPTGTSSAIDHGATSVTVGTGQNTRTVTAPQTDFFGNLRPAGAAYDIGAVEVGALPATITATLSPATWTTFHTANCPGTGFGVFACLNDPFTIFTLTNTGNVTLTGITQATLSGANAADFAVFFSTCGPAGGGQVIANTTLAPGAFCNVIVQFKPLTAEAAGTKTATLSITDLAAHVEDAAAPNHPGDEGLIALAREHFHIVQREDLRVG